MKEATKNIESGFHDRKLYQIENMSIEDTKDKIECLKRAFEYKLKIHIGLKIEMIRRVYMMKNLIK